MPKGFPLTQQEIDLRRHEIAQAAIPLIVESGFLETSMSGIARSAGMGKSTLYDYFQSKDEILVYILNESIEEMIQRAQRVIHTDQDVKTRLTLLMRTHLAFLMENRSFFLKISMEAQRLPLESQHQVQLERYEYQDMVQKLIEQGVQSGEFRPVNAMMVTKTLIALMTPVVYTSRPAGTPEEMLEMGLDLILNGLTA